jgi:DNA repair exonuclease SbcCD ATPase subunit
MTSFWTKKGYKDVGSKSIFYFFNLEGNHMSWKVIEFMEANPEASPVEVIARFATEMEIDTQIANIQQEIRGVMELREELRPLYGEKMNLEANLALLESNFDMEVMVKYPPRQGSDKERKAYKKELQQAHPDYQTDSAKAERLKASIEELEDKMSTIQQSAKNARRLVETFNTFVQFVLHEANKTFSMPNYEELPPQNKNLF